MENHSEHLFNSALSGDINAFQSLFISFQAQLKSYLYRLTASRNDAEDLAHDTFIKAFDKLNTFQGDSSLKHGFFKLLQTLPIMS